MKSTIKILAILTAVFTFAPVWGEIQPLFNYQGRLTDHAGNPSNFGNCPITLKIYDQPTGGTALRTAVYGCEVKNGYFNIQFGSEETMNISTLPFDTQYYLGITIGTNPENTPREKLGHVAYSMRSKTSIKADTATLAETVADNSITSAKIVDGTITGADIGNTSGNRITNTHIENNAIDSRTIANNAVTGDKILNGTITQNKLVPSATLPVGSIIPFFNLNDPSSQTLPDGWVPCNGQVLTEGPFTGRTVPNLNSSKRFLRGGTTAGVMQADELKSHNHKVIASWMSGNRTEWHVVADHTDPNEGPVSESHGPSLTHTGGDETRPINMSVIWIMKVK